MPNRNRICPNTHCHRIFWEHTIVHRTCQRCSECINCHREDTTGREDRDVVDPAYNVTVLPRNVQNASNRRKFALATLAPSQQTAYLCEQCHAYRVNDTSPKNTSDNAWPAFVWTLLSDAQTWSSAWLLLPKSWKTRWSRAVSRIQGIPEEVLLSRPSLFADVTVGLKKDLDALENLKWSELMSREESLAIPSVKCPAGCSEFKHKCNELPFDIVWQECLQVQLPLLLTMGRKRNNFTRFFRKDYLRSEQIGLNPRWLCQPSIAKTSTGAPVVLCCRHHNHRCSFQMVHVPSNPTGSLSDSRAGGLSPVVPIPRTIQKARMAGYSASFQMAFMEGSFHGIDTMFLSSNQGISSVNSTLGWKQDVLSYAGRSDIQSYTMAKGKKYWNYPGNVARQLHEAASNMYPFMPELKERYCAGATYVCLEDATRLQQYKNLAGPEKGWKTDSNNNRIRVQFRGPYPQYLVWNHPIPTNGGARPPELPKFNKQSNIDTRVPWFLSSMMLLLPEFWSCVASAPEKKDWCWEGYLLAFLTSKYLPHIKIKRSSTSIFPTTISEKDLLAKYFQSTPQFSMRPLVTKLKFRNGGLPGLVVYENCLPENIPDDKRVIVVARDINTLQGSAVNWVPPLQFEPTLGERWKLCYISSIDIPSNARNANDWEGTVYSRYSSSELSGWWKSLRSTDLPLLSDGPPLSDNSWIWDICVFLREDAYITNDLRDQLLSSCGGQHTVYCREHHYPLISPRKGDGRRCVCATGNIPDVNVQPQAIQHTAICGCKPSYCCTIPTCPSAICRVHHAQVQDVRAKFYVGQTCSYGAILPGNNLPVDDQVLPLDIPLFEQPNDRTTRNIPDNDGDTFESHFHLRDMDIDNYFNTATLQGNDDLEDVLPLDHEDIATMEDDLDPIIPTTDAGTLPIFTAVEGSDYENYTMNNHVVLNNLGHMLIRRNRELSSTLNQNHFLQKMVSRVPGESLPLAYPEGMLFSNLFYADTNRGSIIGALPAALLNDQRTLEEMGFASLEDHYRTRLSHPGLLTSSDPKYHLFAFDCLANLALRGCDSRIILSRGFTEMQKEGGVRVKGKKEAIFDTEQIDSRPMVNKLAAAALEKQPTYFYTHTCSMRTHFGLKLIWDWIAGEEIIQRLCEGHESQDERDKLRQHIVDGSGVLLLRVWMEMIHIWINYLAKSDEQPIGHVDQFLFRMELQDAKANLPHLHAMIWTHDDLNTPEGLATALDRIRGFILDIIRPEERERYKEEGIFEDDESVTRFLSMITTFLTHTHNRRCFIQKKRKRGGDRDPDDPTDIDAELKCKSNMNYRDNPWPAQHSFVTLPIQHSDEAIQVLVLTGLARVSATGEFVPLANCLKAIKHYPPAHGDEGIIQPVFGSLAARNPNMGNVQFATGYTLSRYLTKYIVMMDLYNAFRITPPKPTEDPNTFHVHGTELMNQKITGNRIVHNQSTDKSTGKLVRTRHGRAFNVAEFYMMLFGYSAILTNIEFTKITTRTYEERPASERQKPMDAILDQLPLQQNALTQIDCIPSHNVRLQLNLPAWRQFMATQLDVVYDDMQSPLTTSTVTKFSARPPELMFASRQKEYYRWFTLRPKRGKLEMVLQWTQKHIRQELSKSVWMDGFNNHVRVRAAALQEVITCLLRARHTWFGGYNAMLLLLEEIQTALNTSPILRTEAQSSLLYRFVSDLDKTRLPVVWFESVRPTRVNRFLIHLLLGLGYIKDEYDLFLTPSLRDSFIRANLLDPAHPENSAINLMREYILTQHASMPTGTITFDRYLVVAYQSIMEMFVHNRLYSDDIPTVLYTRLRDETDNSILDHIEGRREALIRYIVAKLGEAEVRNIPSAASTLEATLHAPVNWDPLTASRPPLQPEASFAEQQSVLRLGIHLIQHYKTAPNEYTKGICHVGAGGVGKTTLMLIEVLYAFCQGLHAAITAMLSERAQELSGTHIHDMFAMTGNDTLSAGQLAERACSSLYRMPHKIEYLRHLDILAIDESGAVPCEVLAAMCTVLRYIRNSNRPFGGMLLLSTMDHLQLEPVSGRHPLLSPFFTSCFFFKQLQHSVRAAHDARWRRIQTITRMASSTLQRNDHRKEFVELFVSTCSFVTSLDDPSLPQNILFAFGKKAPIRDEERRILRNIQSQTTIPYKVSIAQDEERTIDGTFQQASLYTSNSLDRQVKEPRKLVLYPGGRYQITYNKPNVFSNSQLAILFELPPQQTLDAKNPIPLIVAPPGCRFIPDGSSTRQDLEAMGWVEKFVGCPSANQVQNTSGRMRARRRQYGLRHHVGSTIHGIMGQTLNCLITRIERGDKTHKYALWMASQVVVLLSRTKKGRDTFFWLYGDSTPEETADALYDLLCVTTPFREHLTRILDNLCNGNSSSSPYSQGTPTMVFRPRDTAIPPHRLGFVYMLVSTRELSTIYLGSTFDLKKRWERHNKGFGAKQTSPIHLRPWAILAYIVGFDGNRAQFELVENLWIAAKERMRRDHSTRLSVQAILNKGKDIVADYNRHNPLCLLRFVSCGTIEKMADDPNFRNA